MRRLWTEDPLAWHLEAHRRLKARRLRRTRRRATKVAPWLVGAWVLLNIPPVVLLVTVIVARTATLSELVRYVVAVVLWALISGGGLLFLVWGGLVALEIGARPARHAGRRRRFAASAGDCVDLRGRRGNPPPVRSEGMDGSDRWFDTPATYSRDEARQIKRHVAERRQRVMCPRCNAQLMFGTPITQRNKVIWQVRCPECNRSVIIRETQEEDETPS